MIYDSATAAQHFLCDHILNNPNFTTPTTSELIDSHMCIRWSYDYSAPHYIPDEAIPQLRPLNLPYLLAELAWYYSASRYLCDIARHSSFWARISDDGYSSNSAYGYLLQTKAGFNQIDQITALLLDDQQSRRAVLYFGGPNVNRATTKDEICTTSLQILLRENEKDPNIKTCFGIVMMRSQDMQYGFTYDVPYFASLITLFAKRFKATRCEMHLHVGSQHIYHKDEQVLRELVDRPRNSYKSDNIRINVDYIKSNANNILLLDRASIQKATEDLAWSYYDPQKEEYKCTT